MAELVARQAYTPSYCNLKAGKSTQEIMEAFPSLTEEDIEAARAQLTSVA